jgi:hypothetical protein
MFLGDDQRAPARQSISGARTADGGNDSMCQPKCVGGRAWSPCDAGGVPSAPLGLASARRGANSRLLATLRLDVEGRRFGTAHFLLNDGAYTIQGPWSPGAVNFVAGRPTESPLR